MSDKAWITVVVVAVAIAILAATSVGMDLVFLAALTTLILTGVLTTHEAFAGFANESMLAIGVIYVLVAGLRETGGVTLIARRIFGTPKSVFDAQVRLLVSTTTISAWIYDNPLVAMMLPTVDDWAKRHGIPVSKVMIPLSYAALLGGGITLVGTSTNLIVDGLMRKSGLRGFTLFEFTPVGIPVAIVGVLTILATAKWLLPDRQPPVTAQGDIREYTAEVMVDPRGPLVGRTIEEAGMRNLPGTYIAEVMRGDQIIAAVGPQFRLEGNDRLILVGAVASVLDLHKTHGLIPAGEQVWKLDSKRPQRILIEAVVSKSSPLVGKSVRAGRFRSVYNAVIIAVARDGERLGGKIGDIVLRAGDTLLLEAKPTFFDQQRNSRDFYLVSRVENSRPLRHEKAVLAVAIVVGMIAVTALKVMDLLTASLVAAGLMIGARCVSASTARRNVDWTVLIVIAASFGLSTALEKTGAGTAISQAVTHFAGTSPIVTLAVVYFLTTLFTEVLSHHAAAAVMVPIALGLARDLHLSPMPYMVAIVMATAMGFATPVAHQTNLMVYGPGGYRFSDYMKLGLLLDVVCGAAAVALIPVFIPFR